MASRPVHVVVPLDDRLDEAMERFRARPEAWLPISDTSSPLGGGHALDLATGGRLPGPHVTVMAHVGPILEAADGVAIRTLSWYALRHASALPALDADVELDLRSDGGRRPCLRLVGNYVTPLAVVGEPADRLVPRRLVTEVARGLLTTVARRLQGLDSHAGRTSNGRAVAAAGGVPSPPGHPDPGAGSIVRAARSPWGEDGTTSGTGGATAGQPRGTTRPAERRVAMTAPDSQSDDPAAAAGDLSDPTAAEISGDQERDRLGLVVLTRDECWDRLEEEPVGRLALVVQERPYLVPINHVVRGRELYMVSVAGTKLHELLLRPGQPAAFEVDGYDAQRRTGWSVVVHGHLHPIEDLVEHTYQDVRGRPLWLDGFPDRAWMRLEPEQIEGRVLDHGGTGP